MRNLEASAQNLIKDVEYTLNHVSQQDTSNFLDCIEKAKRIFVYGRGRSGLIGQAFSMRLVHLGKQAYFVGDATTPSIRQDDLLIAISNSGKTPSVLSIAQIAKSEQALLIGITGNHQSPMGKLADFSVELPSSEKNWLFWPDTEHLPDNTNSHIKLPRDRINQHFPLGTLFELGAMLYLDSLIPILMEEMGETEDRMKARHSNLE